MAFFLGSLKALRNWIIGHKFLVLAVVLVSSPFIVAWLRGQLLYFFDMAFITAPEEDIYAIFQHSWQLPLWAPQMQGGYPLIAISHQGFFYPLHFVLRQFLPGIIVINISLLVHFLLATIGTYLFLREEGFNRDASGVGAFFLGGTGFFVGRLFLTNLILPFAWLPILLWLLSAWLHTKKIKYLLGLSISMALQTILGQPQVGIMTALILTLFTLVFITINRKKFLFPVFMLLPAAALTLVLSYVQIQPTLALIQQSDRSEAIQTKDLYEFSYPMSQVVTMVFPHAFGTLDSYFGGKNEVELGSWTGVGFLLLIVIGICCIKVNKLNHFLFPGLLVLLSLFLAIGKYSLFYTFLVERGVFNSMAIPARWLVLFFVGATYFIANGIEVLPGLSKKKMRVVLLFTIAVAISFLAIGFKSMGTETLKRVMAELFAHPFLTAIPFVVVFVFIVISLYFKLRKTWIIFFIVALEVLIPNFSHFYTTKAADVFRPAFFENFLRGIKGTPLGMAPRFYSGYELSVDPEIRVNNEPLITLEQGTVVKQNFESIGSEISGLKTEFRWGRRRKTPGIINISLRDKKNNEERTVSIQRETITDAEALTINFVPIKNTLGHPIEVSISSGNSGPWTLYYSYPKDRQVDILLGGSLEICKEQECAEPKLGSLAPGTSDLAIEPIYEQANKYLDAKERLTPNIGPSKGLSTIQWAGALALKEVKKYLYDIGDQSEVPETSNYLLKTRREMVNRLGIQYFLGSYSGSNNLGSMQNIKFVQETLKNQRWLRMFENLEVRPRAEFVPSTISVQDAIAARSYMENLKSSSDPTPIENFYKDTTQFSIGTVSIESYLPTEVLLYTKNNEEGLLVLRDTYYPDWHAYVDGKETKIYPADWIFRGIIVPAGEHNIKFSYQPVKTIRAIWISLIAWIVFIAIGIIFFFKKKNRN